MAIQRDFFEVKGYEKGKVLLFPLGYSSSQIRSTYAKQKPYTMVTSFRIQKEKERERD